MDSITSWLIGGIAIVFSLGQLGAATSQAPSLQPPTAPVIITGKTPAITTTAAAILILDANTNHEIYSQNADQIRAMASLTKLMTAYIIARNHKSDEMVTIPPSVTSVQAGDSVVLGLRPGDQVSVGQLLQALLIPSANDAAVSLAVFHAGSESAFVDTMNRTARELGMTNTTYKNPSGLDADGHVSTARDLARLTHYVLESPLIAQTVRQNQATIITQQGRSYKLVSTNKLLGQSGVIGVKTGTTGAAGECLITLSERSGRKVLTVMLGSQNRFPETRSMLDLTFGLNYY